VVVRERFTLVHLRSWSWCGFLSYLASYLSQQADLPYNPDGYGALYRVFKYPIEGMVQVDNCSAEDIACLKQVLICTSEMCRSLRLLSHKEWKTEMQSRSSIDVWLNLIAGTIDYTLNYQ